MLYEVITLPLAENLFTTEEPGVPEEFRTVGRVKNLRGDHLNVVRRGFLALFPDIDEDHVQLTVEIFTKLLENP